MEITPVPFRPKRRHPKPGSGGKWVIGAALALILILLCTSVWFVFTARQVIIRIEPDPEKISIQGGIAAPKFGDYYLLRPGSYTLKAEHACFHPFKGGNA